jgi:uncharacterized DUF497 family protein
MPVRRFDFRWVEWNLEHATRHGVNPEECEQVVRTGRYRRASEEKYRAVGRGQGGRWIQVIFAFTEDDEVFVISARPLTDREKTRERRN